VEQQARPSLISWPVALAAICGLALYFHSVFWWTEPRDLSLFLRPWFDHIIHYGPVGAFAHPFSNYTPAYLYFLAATSPFHGTIDVMYIVKLLSVAGTAFAAYALFDLIKALGGDAKWAVLLFIAPSVVINAALLGQCDALWGGACVLAVAAMIRGLTVRSLIWCGIAIAFKAQAVFIAPFIIGALIGRRAPLWQWTIPALVFVATMLPAWLAGWPAEQLAMIYPNQASWGDLPGRLATPWILATLYAPAVARDYYWAGFATAGIAAAAVVALVSASAQNRRAMVLLALLSSLALPFFLPKMLERYFFLADLLSIAIAITYRTRLTIFIAVAVQAASLLSLLAYMYFYARPYPTLIGAAMSASALALTFILARRWGARWPAFPQLKTLAQANA
jgi:Gpi18-like mannosyltransferase